jgi:hypothetical protein
MFLKVMAFLIALALVAFVGLVLIGAFSQYQDEALDRGFEGARDRFRAGIHGFSESGPWHAKRAIEQNKLPDFEQ